MRHPLCKLTEIPESGTRVVPFFGREIHLYRHGGEPKAALSICPHLGGPLSCEGGRLVCPWHGAEFSLSDGRRLKPPAAIDARLMFLPTRAEGDTLYYVWGE